MRITTLGSLELDGRPVRGERLAAVVRELVDARGRAVSVAALADAVWTDDPPEDVAGAVQALVSRVRRLGLPVTAVPGGYRVPFDDPALGIGVDVVDVRALVGRAREALHASDAVDALVHADAARALVPAAPAVDDAQSARLLSDVADVRARAQLALGGPYDESDLRTLAARTPPDEPAVALLVHVLAAQGRDAEALDVVEHVRAELADRYGTDPSPVVAAAHVALLRGELGPAARPDALSSPTSPPVAPPRGPVRVPRRAVGPLPPAWRRPPTSLVGRDDDVTTVLGALRRAPLVTVVATGGAGKTRLATEVVHRVVRDGRAAVVVELAGVRTPDEVLPAVLAALGGAETSGARADLAQRRRLLTVAERLGAAVQDLEGVVVLDNCEHLLAATADVAAELVAVAGDDLAVLATSRAALGVVGEEVHLLRALPDAHALDLLESRARAGRPGLAWDPDAALELCHRLDNLPLALELAAARLRAMTVQDVLDGLDDRFALLDSALRGLPERHASLWTLVDWSRELLDDDSRELLQRLAVIPAPFTASTAAAVAGRDEPTVRRGLATLVEQSLLALDEAGSGPARYRMLETVREYGEARLDAAGAREPTMSALVGWAADESVRLAAQLVGPGQLDAMATCGDEQETFVATLRWALAHDDEVRAVDTAAALFHSWTVRGMHAEVVAWAQRLLGRDDPAARRRSVLYRGASSGRPLPHGDRATLVLLVAAVNSGITASHRIAALAGRALRRIEREQPDEVTPRLRELASALPALTDLDDPGSERTARGLASSSDPFVRALGLFLRAAIRENSGDPGASSQDARAAYRLFEEAGDHWGMGMAAQGVAQWSASRGEPDAVRWLETGVRHLELVGAAQDARSLRILLDLQHALAGDPAAVDALLEVAAAQGDPFDAAQALVGLGRVALEAGRVDEARERALDVLARLASAPRSIPQAHVVYGVSACGLLLRSAGRDDERASADGEVVAVLASLRETVSRLGDMPVVGTWALGGAELAAFRGDRVAARELWALGVRFGANLAAATGPGALPPLAAAFTADADERVAELRTRTVAQVTTLIHEQMATLL